MTNWEKYKEEINTTYKSKYNKMPDKYHAVMAYAIKEVANKYSDKFLISLFDAVDWLTQEAESEEHKSKEELMEEVGCEDCDGCGGCYRDEPQSKTRFIQVDNPKGYIVNVSMIEAIAEKEENRTYIYTTVEDVYTINKPISEVIQQLGIEVV